MKKQRRKRNQDTGIFAPSITTKSTAARVRAYYAKTDELQSKIVTHLWNASIAECSKEGCRFYEDPPPDEPAGFCQWIVGEIDPEYQMDQADILSLKLEMIRRVNKQLLKTPQAKALGILRQRSETAMGHLYPFNIIDYILGSDTLLPICQKLEESLEADTETEHHHLFNHSMNVSVLYGTSAYNFVQLTPFELLFTHSRLSRNRSYTPPIF